MKETDYLWARPALGLHLWPVRCSAPAIKKRGMELQAAQPTRKGYQRGAEYAYNVKVAA